MNLFEQHEQESFTAAISAIHYFNRYLLIKKNTEFSILIKEQIYLNDV